MYLIQTTLCRIQKKQYRIRTLSIEYSNLVTLIQNTVLISFEMEREKGLLRVNDLAKQPEESHQTTQINRGVTDVDDRITVLNNHNSGLSLAF
jgi:hypothetical protein